MLSQMTGSSDLQPLCQVHIYSIFDLILLYFTHLPVHARSLENKGQHSTNSLVIIIIIIGCAPEQ